MLIYKKYYFETAHFMKQFPKSHKYSRIHGHSYELIIYIEGDADNKNEWVVDYDKIDSFVSPLLRKIDHNLLNEIKGLENPTSENIARWFWKGLKKKVKNLVKIEIIRPRIGGCIYEGK